MTVKEVNQVLYAPNVHNGGGLVLLEALLDSFPKQSMLYAILDSRCKKQIEKLMLDNLIIEYWVNPNIFSRLLSEIKLFIMTKKDSHVLCFHNIPPLLCRSKNINIYFQNKLIIDDGLKNYNNKILFSTYLERLIIKYFFRQHMQYYTQTYSTKISLEQWLTKKLNLNCSPKILAFIPHYRVSCDNFQKKWDFLYISSGDAHKNIPALLEAWRLLDLEGLKPSLAITIGNNYPKLNQLLVNQYQDLNIVNLGMLKHSDAIDLYKYTSAYIHPSLVESFGLTLIEAAKFQVPILAPEMDYVRDVCTPVQTFDPYSSLSIARAVMRFLNIPNKSPQIELAEKFWSEILIN